MELLGKMLKAISNKPEKDNKLHLEQQIERQRERQRDYKLLLEFQNAIKHDDLKAFKTSLEKSKQGYLSVIDARDNNRQTLLHYCIEHGSASIFEELIKLGADVTKTVYGKSLCVHLFDIISCTGLSAFSLQEKWSRIAVQLLNHPDTNLKERDEDNSSIIRAFATRIRLSDLKGLSSEKLELLQTIKNIIITGHRYELKGQVTLEEGYILALERFTNGRAAEEMVNTYKAFLENPGVQNTLNVLYNFIPQTKDIDPMEVDVASLLQADLSCVGQPIELQEFLKRDKNGDITPVSVLCTVDGRGHAISYLFYQNFCVRVNCGVSEDTTEVSGIKIYTIGDKNKFLEEIPKILNSLNCPINDSYFHDNFFKAASLKLLYTIPRPPQRSGNCTFRSLKELQYALLLMHFYKYFEKYIDKASEIFPDELSTFQAAQRPAEMVFNLLMLFDNDLGILILHGLKKYFTKTMLFEINQRQVEIEDLCESSWKGFDFRYKGVSEAEAKTLREEAGSLSARKSMLAYYFERTSPVVDKKQHSAAVESKGEIERFTLTQKQLQLFACQIGQVKEGDIKQLFEVIDADMSKNNEDPIYLQFLANVDGLRFIIPSTVEENSYSLAIKTGKCADELKILLRQDVAKSMHR